VNDLETSLLSSRLDRLADDLAPQVDVVDQVRLTRSRHRRARNGRIAVLATVAATALAVGLPTAISVLSSASATHGQVAGPGITAPATPTETTMAADQTAPDQSAAEARALAALAAARARVEASSRGASTPPDGVQFAYIVSTHPASGNEPEGSLTVRFADWLGDGGPADFSCLAGHQPPLTLAEYCVGPAGPDVLVGVGAATITLSPVGDPIHAANFAELSTVVAQDASQSAGPMMGWLTVRNGVVVAFTEVPRQSA
jgi:hypothetical protein